MRPVRLSTSGVSVSPPCPMSPGVNPFNVGLGAVVTGTVTYTVQHTFDDPYSAVGIVTWFPHASMVGLAASADGNYQFAVTAIRLNQTAGSGSVVLNVIPSGI